MAEVRNGSGPRRGLASFETLLIFAAGAAAAVVTVLLLPVAVLCAAGVITLDLMARRFRSSRS